jgi:superfamily II DNA or RNA helicase
MTRLWGFQRELVQTVMGSTSNALVTVPTGSGKTVIASAIIAESPNSYVLFFAHRRELVSQAKDKLAKFGVSAGTIMADESTDAMQRVQVASVQTLHARCIRGKTELPPANIVFVDEAHHVAARTYNSILQRYPNAKIIGLTATPCRRDGRGLGGTFDSLVLGPQVAELIGMGHLVRTVVYAPLESQPDLKGIQVRGGDFAENELAARVDTAQLVGDIVTHWQRHGERRRTVCFATSVAHSIHIRDEFQKAGVKAEHIDGSTPTKQRDETLQRLEQGELELVTNCMILVEGWDQPSVSCCILARPTKSMGLYRQMVGRVIRACDGKHDAIILDHAGAVFLHGFVETPMEWTLEPDQKAKLSLTESLRKNKPSDRVCECVKCHAMRTAGLPCPHCGYYPQRRGTPLEVIDGDLAKLERNGRLTPHRYTDADKASWLAQLTAIRERMGHSPGWIAHTYKSKFGVWPSPYGVKVAPQTPTTEVENYVLSRKIAYAKATGWRR